MNGWICAGLVIAAFAVYTPWMCWRIARGNRPPPHWRNGE